MVLFFYFFSPTFHWSFQSPAQKHIQNFPLSLYKILPIAPSPSFLVWRKPTSPSPAVWWPPAPVPPPSYSVSQFLPLCSSHCASFQFMQLNATFNMRAFSVAIVLATTATASFHLRPVLSAHRSHDSLRKAIPNLHSNPLSYRALTHPFLLQF